MLIRQKSKILSDTLALKLELSSQVQKIILFKMWLVVPIINYVVTF